MYYPRSFSFVLLDPDTEIEVHFIEPRAEFAHRLPSRCSHVPLLPERAHNFNRCGYTNDFTSTSTSEQQFKLADAMLIRFDRDVSKCSDFLIAWI